MVELVLAKHGVGVRFPVSAQSKDKQATALLVLEVKLFKGSNKGTID